MLGTSARRSKHGSWISRGEWLATGGSWCWCSEPERCTACSLQAPSRPFRSAAEHGKRKAARRPTHGDKGAHPAVMQAEGRAVPSAPLQVPLVCLLLFSISALSHAHH